MSLMIGILDINPSVENPFDHSYLRLINSSVLEYLFMTIPCKKPSEAGFYYLNGYPQIF